MKTSRNTIVVLTALISLILIATPASATYWITGWQTSGEAYNDLDGCWGIKYRRSSETVDAFEPVWGCARDIGVRGKGRKGDGSLFEYGVIAWDTRRAYQVVQLSSWDFTHMKVYHGDH